MASNSRRKSGSSASSTGRKRVVIGASETVRVRYKKNEPEVESERRRAPSSRERATPRAPKGPGARLANAKRDEREQRQRALARRRALALAGIVAVVVAAVWGLVALWRAPIFTVERIGVTGNRRLSEADVLARAQVPADVTLVRLSKREIVDRLQKDPWIAEARLDRQFPDALGIEIVERVPVATIDAGGTQVWVVDGSGIWLAKRSAEDTPALPVVRDIDKLVPQAGARSESPELLNALAVLGGLSPELRARVRTVSAPSIDRTALVLPRGVQVIVGSAEDIAKKDTVARAILAENKNVVSVNVRVVNRPTWRGLDSGQ
jgi:cell division protein FtsQ